jgi:hypothetical protein
MRYVLKKAAYYALIGKDELAGLHVDAVDDFRAGRTGKRDIVLGLRYRGTTQVQALLQEPSIRRVLIPWTANLVATRLQEPLVRALKARPDLRIDCLLRPDDARRYQLPGARHVPVSRWRLLRWVQYLRWLRRYDLVLQSDYQPLLGLSWLGREILFINDEGIARLRAPHLAALLRLAVAIARRYLAAHSWRGNRPPAAR